jgi:NADH-quinone oxidoreductase subunit N
MSMNGEATVIKSVNPEKDRISKAALAVLTILLVWFGIYPGLLINVIQSVSLSLG